MSSPPPPTSSPPDGKRRRMLTILAALILSAAVGYGLWWGLVARYREYTDDAYVGGNLVAITPQIAGTVIAVRADDTDLVRQGDTLVSLDPADAQVAYSRAQADLAQAVRQVRALFAGNAQFAATLKLREVELKRAEEDLKRRESAVAAGGVSQEELQHAKSALAAARAGLEVAREQLKTNEAQIAGTEIASHPTVAAAAARVREAFLATRRLAIVSPVTGYVARRSVQVGARANPGTPLMAVVPLSELCVDANFKEVQLAHIRIGQPVTLAADLYGDSVEYRGKVIGLGAGTGSAFSLLPPQNATGNWIKVVQRLPVRITLESEQLKEHPLRVGLSMQVTVDTRDRQGGVLAEAPRSTPLYTTAAFDVDLVEADRLIARIIHANDGSLPQPAPRPRTRG